MEASKCCFAASLIFIMVVLPVIHRILESPEVQYAFIGQITRRLVFREQAEKTFCCRLNLTSCHQSFDRPDLLVYCCPPTNRSNETIVDFQFPDASSPLRVRRPANLVDDNYMAKYNKALSIMKSLPHSDPRSSTRQANLHCLYCTGSYNQQHSNSPLNSHRSWLFFPWHRMLLHFHERIIGSLIGDDTFALPFWTWDTPDGMTIAHMYMNGPFFHKVRDFSHFPPHVVDLDFMYTENSLNPEDQDNTNLAIMYNQMVSGAMKSELFMGCPLKAGEGGFCDGPDTIEIAPHNTVHLWVGTNLLASREDMGEFYSAARDPMFYAHHANIDRLWQVWRGIHKDKEITDPDWLDSYFFFHDGKLRLVRIKIRDVLDITKLRYAYEKVDIPWLHARPNPSVPLKVARDILKVRTSNNMSHLPSLRTLSPDYKPCGQPLDTRMTIKVSRPKIRGTKKEREEEEEVLVVHGIDVKEDTYVKFDVYVNLVNETFDPRFREFAGTFIYSTRSVTLVSEGNKVMRRKTNLKLGLSELLEDLDAEGDESIWVTLLPRPKSCINTTIDGIRIEYLR